MLAPHLAFVPEAYARYTSGTVDFDAFSDDIVWHSSGPPDLIPTGGELRGKSALAEWFTLLRRDWTVEAFDALEFFGDGERMAARVHVRLRRNTTGEVVEIEKADLLTVRNGKIVAFREYFDATPLLACAGYTVTATATA